MGANATSETSLNKPSEALVYVAMDARRAPRRKGLPQVHYGFDRSNFREQASEIWDSLPKDDGLPALFKLRAMMLPLFRVHSMLLLEPQRGADARIAYMGLSVSQMTAARPDISSLSQAPLDSILARLPSFFGDLARLRKPVLFDELPAVGSDGGTTYNGILLPFHGNDGAVSHVYAIIDECMKDGESDDDVLELTSSHFANGRVKPDFASNPDELSDEIDSILDLQFDQVLDQIGADEDVLELNNELEVGTLADYLQRAKSYAAFARASETRSRKALYAAIGEAYDFALAASEAPEEFAAMLDDANLTIQDRAPMTPIVKLVFGTDYDPTRVAEYAAVLGYAEEQGVPPGTLATILIERDGGIKGVLAEVRHSNKVKRITHRSRSMRLRTAKKLRAIDLRPLAELNAQDSEFAVVMVRKDADGTVGIVGEVTADGPLLEKVGKAILSGK